MHLQPRRRIAQAARNNAVWCQAVCRAHGVPGEFHPCAWVNRSKAPLFYSNLVTLSGGEDASDQLDLVGSLLDIPLAGNWSVKDSFMSLDLAPLGFRTLFEASWIWRDPPQAPAALPQPGLVWMWIDGETALARWESAWRGEPANAAGESRERLFLPALLSDPEIAILAAVREGEILAGAIANRTGQVVGLSNVFGVSPDAPPFWDGIVAHVQERFPGLPLVGYEAGEDLEHARAAGFEALGELRVWIRETGA